MKTGWLFPLFLAGVAVLAGRLYNIQVAKHDDLVRRARKQSETTVTLPARRGTMFDATGRPLAVSVNVPAIFADPGIAAVPARIRRWLPQTLGVSRKAFKSFLSAKPAVLPSVNDPTLRRVRLVTRELAAFLTVPEAPLFARLDAAVAARIADAAHKATPVLELPEDELRRTLSRDTRFVWLRRPATDALADRVRALKVRGLCVKEEQRRAVEPVRGLQIGQWLGFVGGEGRGSHGLELVFERRLRGSDGLARLERDGRGRRIAHSSEPIVPPRHGCNLYLTIDSRIQRIVEREVAGVYAEFSPVSVSAIVMDPPTGQVLALASVPGLDLAERDSLTPAELQRRLRNHPVQSVYEYGSTFKPFVAAAVIDLKLATPESRVDCEHGSWRYRGRRLHDHHPYGILSVTDVVAHSSNIGAAKLGLLLGGDRLRQYVSFYHFGRPLGIRLGAEAAGLVTPESRWTYWTTTSVPMGQEIAGTPLQLITAFCSLVNGGKLMQPFLVRAVEDPNTGEPPLPRTPRQLGRVIGPKTSAAMRKILAQVVDHGTARVLRSCKYPIGGKTGTAQKGNPADGKYIASFVGFAPVDDPKICVLVLADEPKGRYYGGQVAAPAVGRIIDDALATLELAPPAGRGTDVIVSRIDATADEITAEGTP